MSAGASETSEGEDQRAGQQHRPAPETIRERAEQQRPEREAVFRD